MVRLMGLQQRRSGAQRAWSAAGIAAMLVLAACGGDDDDSDSTTPGTEAVSDGTEPAGGDDTTAPAPGGSDSALVIARGMDVVGTLDPQRAYCDTCQIFMTAVYETLIGLDTDNTTLVAASGHVVGEQPRADRVHVHPRPRGHVRRRLAGHQRRRQVLVGATEGPAGSSSYLAGSIETIDDTRPARRSRSR